LGADASELTARIARYDFLQRVRAASSAQALITAHHQDDLLETMVLNLIRGTNRKGLASLQSRGQLIRPFLHIPKSTIREYAAAHHIIWREDSTNLDTRYLRNHVRQYIMPGLDFQKRVALLEINQKALAHNHEIDLLVADILTNLGGPDKINRQQFIQLPHAISREIMAAWLRAHHIQDITAQQIERLVATTKTARLDTVHDVDRLKIMNIGRKFVEITPRKSS
jgi:tRNA(Ile)-lysidine synthase TilS/MesJ